ncbi:MAG TPA: HTH domain-containing protein [Roseobacter sp.]|uniref:HTH deoR-type domain-containing protein n=1 Tax=marine sediment metagenome TaxID=412755 RepID=A0A0F9UY21_9ZZZZ|nr:HTH domain-containing protein [Roseobacter sp.]|tara:strand:+ start:2554 stop:3207 length:654 start_codon:yes stop_codon:yes gene_type:complete
MRRSNRLFRLLEILGDHQRHRSQDLARSLAVSQRTLFRDMDRLKASGVPLHGTRGLGYQLAAETTLPPLTLTDPEIEALQLALAVVLETTDPDLQVAVQSLVAKIDASLPLDTTPQAADWRHIEHPFANAARGLGHLPVLRAAIKARQKLKIVYNAENGAVTTSTLHPNTLTHQARSWILSGWDEIEHAPATFRLDLIESADPLPELFSQGTGFQMD